MDEFEQFENVAPNFIGESQIGSIGFHDFVSGTWCLVVGFPHNFNPVWLTELGCLSKLYNEFEARNCKVLAICVGPEVEHETLVLHVNETQDTSIPFPVICDHDATISKDLGLVPRDFEIEKQRFRFSTAMILDLDASIKCKVQYPTTVGRNFYEVLRTIDALQLASQNRIVTPTNWKINDDVFIDPDITPSAAKKLFPQGFHEIKAYFRITPSPATSDIA